jgi:uncharacterized protein (DUF983 family)
MESEVLMNQVPMKLAARRAILGRCPCCGEGKLFRAYLKQVDNCSVCGEAFGHIRADDAAPWLTLILVGHIFVPVMLLFVASSTLPAWESSVLWSVVFMGACLAILPRAKGLFIAILKQTSAGEGKLKAVA